MQNISHLRSRLVGAILMLATMLALAVSGPGLNMLAAQPKPVDRSSISKPTEQAMKKASTFNGDLRTLPQTKPAKQERTEREPPHNPVPLFSGPASAAPSAPNVPMAPMPT